MRYQELAPEARLKSLVAGFWAFPPNDQVHRILPDGCMDIVVLNGSARLVGAMQQAAVVPATKAPVVGIRMRPGEVARLFGGLAKEVVDSEAPLAQIWREDGPRLEDALLAVLENAARNAHDAGEIIRHAQPIMEDALRRRLASHAKSSDLLIRSAAVLLGDGVGVHEVAVQLGISERQLARRFTDRVGLGPRTFARVRRLQRAALEMQRGASPSAAAMLVGYTDQAHFTRESRDLAGITPAALSRELCDGFDTSVPVLL